MVNEAGMLTALSSGEAQVIISAGSVALTINIIVSDPTPTVRYTTLSDVILYTNDWIRLTVYWADSRTTVFERINDSPVWTMVSRDGNYRIVEPNFIFDAGEVIIGFPTTRQEYNLHVDHTGDFGGEALTWEFETDSFYMAGADSGAYQRSDLQWAMSRYSLIVIHVYWLNGDTTIFYREDSGNWMMKARNNAYTSVQPEFNYSSDRVTMYLSDTSNLYSLADGGMGVSDGESFTWDYSYYG